MVFTQNALPNLVDWANMADPDGKIADIAMVEIDKLAKASKKKTK